MSKSIGKNLLSNKFKVFPVKFSESSTAVSYLFYKLHQSRDQDNDKPSGRTLFVINIPPYCTEECFGRLFSDCGSVERVVFQRTTGSEHTKEELKSLNYNPNIIHGYKVAYIVFREPEHCAAAMNLTDDSPRLLSTNEHPLSVGIKKWCEDYNEAIADINELQEGIDKYMNVYDKNVEEKIRTEKEMDGVPDEEGWVTVTRHGNKPVTLRNESQDKKAVQKMKKKQSQKELKNFYVFQIRESKMKHIDELRKKLEEDKHRIALMKESRKYRPY
ncbi:hypothetical protein CHUAL_011820 [Chamberlinius hualienensis]